MLSDTQITAGQDRLSGGKLTPTDVDSLIANFRLLVGSLESQYGWDFETDLTVLDDTRSKASKMAAILLLLISDGFSVLELTGKNNVAISKTDQRKLTILYAFSLLYKIPVELTELQVILIGSIQSYSHSVETARVW